MVACGQTQPGSEKPEKAAGSAAVLPLNGSLPSDPAAAALKLQKMNFPAGSSAVRVYVQAPGLQTGTTEASGYVGSVSSGHAREMPQDFQLHLELGQVRALMSSRGLVDEKSKPVVLIEAIDRAGRPVPGVKAEMAVLVDAKGAPRTN